MRSSNVSAFADEATRANARAVIVFSIGLPGDFVIPGRCEASNPESRDSGSGANAPSRNDGRDYDSFFNILNTPLAVAIQRFSAVTSVVTKIRLRVARTTRGFDTRISPILQLSTKWVSICTVAIVVRP